MCFDAAFPSSDEGPLGRYFRLRFIFKRARRAVLREVGPFPRWKAAMVWQDVRRAVPAKLSVERGLASTATAIIRFTHFGSGIINPISPAN